MSFFGLFGHDQNPSGAPTPGVPNMLPTVPPGIGGGISTMSGLQPQSPVAGQDLPQAPQAPAAPQLPPVPPQVKQASIWDKQHWRDTMLGVSQGFLSGFNFADGLGNAVGSVRKSQAGLQNQGKPQLGGPDDSFEVYTNPTTGEHTFKPIQAVQDYENKKKIKSRDVADINGRVMYAIGQLPVEQRAAAYQSVIAHPEQYGVDASAMPTQYDPAYGSISSNMGMTVSQALTRNQAATNQGNLQDYRAGEAADRAKRTEIAGARADAATSQGQARLGIAQAGLGLRQNADARAAHNSARSDLKAGIIGGYQYRRDPVTGQLQRRKVQ